MPTGVKASDALIAEPLWGDSLAQSDVEVPDRFWGCYCILYLLGVGSLLPWNALITPTEYFALRLDGSPFISSFESILSVSFTFFSFTWVVLLQWLQHIIPIRVCILGGLMLLLLALGTLTILAIQPLFASSDDDLLDMLASGATSQFVALISCAAICGIGQAFLTVMTYSYAAVYQRPQYLQAISGGQGVAGLAVTLANVFLKLPGIVHSCASGDRRRLAEASATATQQEAPFVAALAREAAAAEGPNRGFVGAASDDSSASDAAHARDLVLAASVYFGASCVIILSCIVGFVVLERLPFTRARKRMAGRPSALPSSTPPSEPLTSDASARMCLTDAPPSLEESTNRVVDALIADQHRGGLGTTLALLGRLWKWAASICLIYIVTISIFPSLTVTITSSGGSCAWKELFGPLGFVVFNLGDTIGRNLPCLPTSATFILAAVVARVCFAPLFMLCYTGSGDAAGPLQLPTFAATDGLPLLLMLLFSATNGWLTSAVMVSSQREGVMPSSQRQQGATLLVCFLNTGIFFGAALSFIVRFLNCTPSETNGFDCNPFLTSVNLSAA